MRNPTRAQTYLEGIYKYDAIIENKMAEVEKYRCIASGITSTTEGERVQSSGTKSKMADAINLVVDLETEIAELIEKSLNERREIIRTIEQMDAMDYDVLHKRYVQRLTFDEIGASRNMSKSWATTVHGRALQRLNKILDNRN